MANVIIMKTMRALTVCARASALDFYPAVLKLKLPETNHHPKLVKIKESGFDMGKVQNCGKGKGGFAKRREVVLSCDSRCVGSEGRWVPCMQI